MKKKYMVQLNKNKDDFEREQENYIRKLNIAVII